MEPYVDDEIVLHSEGFVEGKTGWSLRKSGAFELFAFGRLRMRTALHEIEPSFLIIDKRKMKLEPVTEDLSAFTIDPKSWAARLSQADIDAMAINAARITSGQGVSVVNNISAPSVCTESLRQFVVKELIRTRHGRSGDELVSDAKKLVEFIEGDKKCQG